MSHQCTCDKTTTTICVQAVGTCQAVSAKVLSGYVKHILWGVERFFGAFGGKCIICIIFYVNLGISNFIYIH